jgi:NTE family protein
MASGSSKASPETSRTASPSDNPAHPRLAAVFAGGGARAAYQAGVLRAIGRRVPKLRIPILTGVSAGAINTSFIAAHPGPLGESAEALCEIWSRIEIDDVFRTDVKSLGKNALRWMGYLGLGGSRLSPSVEGLVDTEPLRQLLRWGLGTEEGPIEGITRNLEAGNLEAVALLTVNYGTGQTVSWVDGREIETWERPERLARHTPLTVEHVMASAALPLLFPAVRLGNDWYGDGGIRLSAPLSPALHLGADRLLAISPRYARSSAEAARSSIDSYPPPAQIAGNLLNAIFLDVLDQDVERLERLNRVVSRLPADERQGLKPVDILLLRPSADLGRLADGYEERLPRTFRFLTRGLGTGKTESQDALSLLMFQPDYLSRLVELGEKDTEARMDEVLALVCA